MKPELTLKSLHESGELAQRDPEQSRDTQSTDQQKSDLGAPIHPAHPLHLPNSSDSHSAESKPDERYSTSSAPSKTVTVMDDKTGWLRKFGMKRTILTIVAVAATATIGIASYLHFGQPAKKDAAKGPPPVVTVSTTTTKLEDMDDVLNVTGSVSAWDPLSIGSEVGGLRIKSVNVEEGDLVKEGQPLAVLNSALLKAKLDQARARLDSAKASVSKALQPNRSEDILALQAAASQTNAAVAQEEAHRKQCHVNLINAELNAKRFHDLARMGAVSSQDAETKQVSLDTAREELKSAQEKVRAAGFLAQQAQQKLLAATRGGRSEDIAISRASLAEMSAQVGHLEEEIAQTIIRAPDDGMISRRDAHIGDIASAGTPLFSLIRMNRLELRAHVNDIDLHRFQPGQVVKISTHEDAAGSDEIAGTVRLVSPQVDPSTRLGMVRIDLPAHKGLKAGMFVRGHVRLATRKAVTVPVQALIQRNGESLVFRLEGDRAVENRVKTGAQTAKLVEIVSGLTPDQVVITKGARFLSDKDVVKVSP